MPDPDLLRSDSGFSSLEAAIALGISAAVIGLCFSLFAHWTQKAAVAENRLLAAKKAEALIARVGLDIRPVPQQQRGTETQRFAWEFSLRRADASLPPPRLLHARFSARSLDNNTPLFEIDVPVETEAAQ